MSKPIVAVMFLITSFAAASPSKASADDPSNRVVENLHALAQLYGVVRWFHPTDEAAQIDWNRYAVVGVQDVRDARDTAELQQALKAWVAPIGPSVQILRTGEQPAPWSVDSSLPQVAWQHLGPGFDGGQWQVYRSKRTNRPGEMVEARNWVASAQRVDATQFRGKTVRLRARVRAGIAAQVRAWLRVDLDTGRRGFYDNMQDRPVTSIEWTDVVIEGHVSDRASELVFGGLLVGDEGWFDSFRLEVSDNQKAWGSVPIVNPEMEKGVDGWVIGTGRGDTLESGLTLDPAARDGGPAMRLALETIPLTEDLFESRPAPGEITVVELGSELKAHVPLVLSSVADATVPAGDLRTAQSRSSGYAMTAGDHAVRIADVIVAWNVLAHFYPYHEFLSSAWSQQLDSLLMEVLAAGPDEHSQTLLRLIAAIEDGHGWLRWGVVESSLPVLFGLVEDEVMVLASMTPELARGDIVLSIDGERAHEVLRDKREMASGSPQRRTYMALSRLGNGAAGSIAEMAIERAGETHQVQVARQGNARPERREYPPIGEVQPGIWLIDMSRAAMTEIQARIEDIASAAGVILDMRGHPNGTHELIRHLLPAEENARWMFVAQIVRPNLQGEALTSWQSHSWDMSPADPRISGKVAVLTGPGAMSYAESVMGYFEALRLPIFGEATAGTNGNIREVPLPSGERFTFTGMKVTRHDGTRSHLQGIRPTVTVKPTIAGVRAGRDEVLDRALEWVMAEVSENAEAVPASD